jgi:hypothetical protein
MATGSIFVLLTNDGKPDQLLLASQLLKKRLAEVESIKKRAGAKDTTPSLLDISRTHLLFTTANYKPHVAIGFEYQKVRPTGSATMGSEVAFSIPQFGDVFLDMVMYVKFNTVTYTPTVADPNRDVIRYCDYPGERLCDYVKFDVNSNIIDEYNPYAYVFYRQTMLQPNKETGYKILMGQEVPLEAYMSQVSTTQPSTRVKVELYNGNQTGSATKPQLELMVPLMFPWCKDPRLGIPSVAIPYGQRFVRVGLTQSANLIEKTTPASANGSDAGVVPTLTVSEVSLYVNNLFMNAEIHDILIKKIGFTLIRVHKFHQQRVSTDDIDVQLTNLKWPTEALFIGLQPVSNFDSTTSGTGDTKSSGKGTLQAWHRFAGSAYSVKNVDGVQSAALDTVAVSELASLNAVAAGTSVADTLNSYNTITYSTTQTYPTSVQAQAILGVAATAAGATGATAASIVAEVKGAIGLVVNPIKLTTNPATCVVNTLTSSVVKLSITAHGIPLYNEFGAMFHNAYLPWAYGSDRIRTPSDPGVNVVWFCLYPGLYQPSGHINISRAREFFLHYKSNGIVSTGNPHQLVVLASAINFLLISDGSAVLRYST